VQVLVLQWRTLLPQKQKGRCRDGPLRSSHR
jgi:hypothetical protein